MSAPHSQTVDELLDQLHNLIRYGCVGAEGDYDAGMECGAGDYVDGDQVSAIAEQIRAALSAGPAERDPNDPDQVEHANELAAALIEARVELVAIRPDAARYRWLRQHLEVQADGPDEWTCWLGLACLPYRSKTESAEELLDMMMARFPQSDATDGVTK